jgi:hypothetical protein
MLEIRKRNPANSERSTVNRGLIASRAVFRKKFANFVFRSEKTSFASNTSGSLAVKLKAHDWLLRHG